MTWRATSAGTTTRNVIDMHLESAFLELTGIL